MNHKEILKSAASILNDRAKEYGDDVACFNRISKLASLVLNKDVSEYDVAMILHCVKLGRLQESRTKADNYIDGVNYLAFGAQFAQGVNSVAVAAADDIASFAKKWAPAGSVVEVEK